MNEPVSDSLEITESRTSEVGGLDGEVLHRDSLGTEQLIRPGQLN